MIGVSLQSKIHHKTVVAILPFEFTLYVDITRQSNSDSVLPIAQEGYAILRDSAINISIMQTTEGTRVTQKNARVNTHEPHTSVDEQYRSQSIECSAQLYWNLATEACLENLRTRSERTLPVQGCIDAASGYRIQYGVSRYRNSVPYHGTVLEHRIGTPYQGIVSGFRIMAPFQDTVSKHRIRVPEKAKDGSKRCR